MIARAELIYSRSVHVYFVSLRKVNCNLRLYEYSEAENAFSSQ